MVRINAGGLVPSGDWMADTYFVGGQTQSMNNTNAITVAEMEHRDTESVFGTYRYGIFDYEIPIPPGNYIAVLHFMELDANSSIGENVFDIYIEDEVAFEKVDVVAGGPLHPYALSTPFVCLDGHVSMHFRTVRGRPFLSALEIHAIGDHLAHAVAGGPYEGVDVDDVGFAAISVDGTASHTHGPGRSLVSWEWYEDSRLIGFGEVESFLCSVGTHEISLRVVDDGGNEHSETTTITIKAAGHPVISSLQPSSGNMTGGNVVVVTGHGFKYNETETKVKIGSLATLSGNETISVVNETTIFVMGMPSSTLGAPAFVTVTTPAGESNVGTYTYIDRVPMEWKRGVRSIVQVLLFTSQYHRLFVADSIPSARTILSRIRPRRKFVCRYHRR